MYFQGPMEKQGPNGERTGVWHFVRSWDTGGYPVGRCTKECTHATADEARAHYKQFLMEECLRFTPDVENADTMHRCKAPGGCARYTSGTGSVAGESPAYTWPLCGEHRTAETMDRLIGLPGDSWRS